MQKALHHCLHCLHRGLPWGRDYKPTLLCPRPGRQVNSHCYSRYDSPKLRQNLLCGQDLSLHLLLSRKMGKERMFLQPEILVCWLKSSLPSQSLCECHLLSSSSPPVNLHPFFAGVLHPENYLFPHPILPCWQPLFSLFKMLLSPHCSSPNHSSWAFFASSSWASS